MPKNLFAAFILMFLLSLGGCSGNSMTELAASKAEKQNLQAIYLSRENGYFTAAEFERQQHAELTSDFSTFIRLADQFPDAVLLIDYNAIQDVDIQRLKETMGRNERLLLIGYQNPREKIGLEEYWDKPHENPITPVPEYGFCHFAYKTAWKKESFMNIINQLNDKNIDVIFCADKGLCILNNSINKYVDANPNAFYGITTDGYDASIEKHGFAIFYSHLLDRLDQIKCNYDGYTRMMDYIASAKKPGGRK